MFITNFRVWFFFAVLFSQLHRTFLVNFTNRAVITNIFFVWKTEKLLYCFDQFCSYLKNNRQSGSDSGEGNKKRSQAWQPYGVIADRSRDLAPKYRGKVLLGEGAEGAEEIIRKLSLAKKQGKRCGKKLDIEVIDISFQAHRPCT